VDALEKQQLLESLESGRDALLAAVAEPSRPHRNDGQIQEIRAALDAAR
jgi:hypothetical protein